MYEKNVRIINFFLLFLIVAFLSLAVRCFYLQFFRSEHYIDISSKQQRGRLTQKPQRGVILDCRGRVLAASNRVRTIFAEPRVIENPLNTSVRLAPIVKMRATEIIRLVRESRNPGFAKIKVGASVEQCSAARKIYGIGVQTDWQRHYPMGRLAAHVVGFTSVDNRGLNGIELRYNKQLGGSAGQNIFLADAFRRPVRLKRRTGVLTNGVGIILTLDAAIQQFARGELVKQYESYEADSAVAIVVSAKTGAILAMVSLPDFDPVRDPTRKVSNGADPEVPAGARHSWGPNTLRNRAISDQFEPGSILKPIVAAIAIDSGVVNKDEKIFCENGNYHGRGFGRIGEYRRGFGDLTVREILVQSSNIGMAKIGQRLGKDKLYKGLKLFGFGKKVGVDLPGEAGGLLRPARDWTGYSVTRIPFGQEISVTAIQLIRAFCILTSGGRSVSPYLVKAVVDSAGEIIELRESSLRHGGVGYIIKPEVAKWIVTEALVGVVNEGTGKRAGLEKWQVFGKTGTAQLAKSNERGYSESDYVASFVAGAPAEEPEAIVLVSIYKPNVKLGKGYTGGTVAAPVAARILEKTLNYLRVPERSL